MFVRKLYYDALSGDQLYGVMMQGSIALTSKERDMQRISVLRPYQDHPQDLGLFLWTEPDPEVEKNMAAATSISVDVSVTPHVIVYDFTPGEVEPVDEALMASEVLSAITGEEVE